MPNRQVFEVDGGVWLPSASLTAADATRPREFTGIDDPALVSTITLARGDRRYLSHGTTVTQPPSLPDRGAVSISDYTQAASIGLTLPSAATFVVFNVNDTTTMLNTKLRSLGATDILVLPERSAPYLIDSSLGFPTANGGYLTMVRPTGLGILGLGPGAVVQTSVSSYTAGRQAAGTIPNEAVIEHAKANSYFGNFTMYGQDFGGVAYHAIRQNGGDNSRIERVEFYGAHRGFKDAPPGECGAITGNGGANFTIIGCIIDGRDPATGLRVGASGIMLNNQNNTVVKNTTSGYEYAGIGITHYKVNGGTVWDCDLEYNGSGPAPLAGSCMNFELSSGTHDWQRLKLVCNYKDNVTVMPESTSGGNSGLHISIGSNVAAITATGVDISVDKGPANGVIAIQGGTTYAGGTDVQTVSTIHFVTSATGARRTYNYYGRTPVANT